MIPNFRLDDYYSIILVMQVLFITRMQTGSFLNIFEITYYPDRTINDVIVSWSIKIVHYNSHGYSREK